MHVCNIDTQFQLTFVKDCENKKISNIITCNSKARHHASVLYRQNIQTDLTCRLGKSKQFRVNCSSQHLYNHI